MSSLSTADLYHSGERRLLILDIFFATYFLRGHREGTTQPPGKLDPSLRNIQRLVDLLTTGISESDPFAARVIAASAKITQDGSLGLAVVAQNTPRDSTASGGATVPRPVIKALESKLSGEEVLRQWKSRSINDHFSDIVAILQGFQKGELSDEHQNDFINYVVNHSWSRVGGRLHNIRRLWGHYIQAHPIAVLASYAFTPEETRNIRWTVKSTEFLVGWLRKAQISTQVEEHESPLIITVAGDDLIRVRDEFVTLYRRLERIFLNDRQTNPGEKPRSDEDFKTACRDLVAQADLVTFGIPKVFFEASRWLSNKMESSVSFNPEEISSGSESGGDEDEIEEEADAVADLFGPGPAYQGFIRQLQSVCAAVNATRLPRALARLSLFGTQPLRAYLITIPPTTFSEGERETCFDLFREAIANEASSKAECDNVLQSLEVARRSVACTVHAEANLMGLACLANSSHSEQTDFGLDQQGLQVLHDIFQVEDAPIGVSKKCCWCCWKMYKWLENRRSTTAIATYPKFLLYSSHNTIFPWAAPDGAPIGFLRELYTELKELVIKVAKHRSLVLPGLSRQTSPAESDIDEASSLELFMID